MRYGVPYKGSKNSIAEWVYSHFPKADNFYDLFAGGCAITHYALTQGNYKNYYVNDILSVPQLFLDAIHGKLKNETRWISREDFKKLKNKELYVRYCWSFGNRGEEYLYSKEVEPWKKAIHYARVLEDFSLLAEFGIHTEKADRITIKNNENEWKQKYILWYCREVLHSSLDIMELRKNLNEQIKRNSEELRTYLIEGLKKANKRPCDVDKYLGTNGMAGHYFGQSQWEFPTKEVYIKLQSFLILPIDYEKIYGLQELLESLQRLQRLQRLQSLQSLESLQRLFITQKDYQEIEIRPGSVIYCDIPYHNTDGYEQDKGNSFDYERFYSWCEKQTEPLFISEYWMPEDRFECIDEIEKTVTLQSGAGNKAIEKLFIPRHQKYDKW